MQGTVLKSLQKRHTKVRLDTLAKGRGPKEAAALTLEGDRWRLSGRLNSPTATQGWKSLLLGVVSSLSPEVCKQHLGRWFSTGAILPSVTFGNV